VVKIDSPLKGRNAREQASSPDKVNSFPPIEGECPVLLILGTMPGVESLRQRQYYGHPRNQFWRIICPLLGAASSLPYEKKTQLLEAHKIALWDVLHECRRAGSLDSAIRDEKPNNLAGFLSKHGTVRRILFNGTPARTLFGRHFPGLLASRRDDLVTLPSTSPACARYTFDEKFSRWRNAMEGFISPGPR
jgi:TDG/mug DNA glycosylase family protein